MRRNKKTPIERFLEREKLMMEAAWPDENFLHNLRNNTIHLVVTSLIQPQSQPTGITTTVAADGYPELPSTSLTFLLFRFRYSNYQSLSSLSLQTLHNKTKKKQRDSQCATQLLFLALPHTKQMLIQTPRSSPAPAHAPPTVNPRRRTRMTLVESR